MEKCVYTVDPENNTSVMQNKSYWNTSKVFGLSRAIELYGYEKAKKDAKKTQEGFVYVLERLFPIDAALQGTIAVTTGKEKIKEKVRIASEMAKEAKDKAKTRILHTSQQ